MRRIDELFPQISFLRRRQMARQLRREGISAAVTGSAPDAADGAGGDLPGAENQHAAPGAPGYPYLLRNLTVVRPDHVWCADITTSRFDAGSST